VLRNKLSERFSLIPYHCQADRACSYAKCKGSLAILECVRSGSE
jgi:hypothetical protein